MSRVTINQTALRRMEEVMVATNLKRVADGILRDAQAMVPVRTGHLRDSGKVEKTGPRKWQVVFTADYARFVEFGTRNMRAQPYLTPAAFKNREAELRGR